MKWLSVSLFAFATAVNGAPVLGEVGDLVGDLVGDVGDLLGLPFPFPWCASTTTITLGGTYTVTSTSTVTSGTSVVTVTAPTSVSISTVKTTSYSPTGISCIQTATTIPPYRAPLITLAPRVPQATAAAVPPATDCPPVTIILPSISGKPCTCITGEFAIATDTVTVTTSAVRTTTTTPVKVITKTEEYILPTPAAYKGVNYYQYLNDYVYPYGQGGCADCGYGGGNYDTADWNGNLSYYTSGLTQNINFESANYLDWNNINCQLPGQAAPSDCGQWTVVFQGFLYAKKSGTYTITPSGLDNALFFWGGEKAYTSYTNGNVDGGASYKQPAGLPSSFGYDLVAGEFMPITFIYVNGYGPARNRVSITEPDGSTYPQDLDLFVPPCPDSPFVP